MAKPTSARDRSKRRASRRPTSSATRASRSRASSNSSRVTRSGQSGRGARVTNAAGRTSTGSARVTTSTRPALPPGKKGGPLAKTESARRQAARARLRGAGQGTTGGTRMGKPGAGGPKTQPRLTGTKTAGQRIRSSGYADDIRSLKRAVKAGGQAAKKAAAKLLKLGIRYVPATKSFVKVAATRGGKAAPGMIIGGKIAASAGTPGAAQMSKLGITGRKTAKTGDAPVYRTPLNKVGRSQATSRTVGPKAVKGGYTISKEAREKAKVSRGNSAKTDSTPAQSKLTKKDPTPKVTAPPKQKQTGDRDKDMATWANANRKMINKVGTKAQRAILARVDAQKKKKKPNMSGNTLSNKNTA